VEYTAVAVILKGSLVDLVQTCRQPDFFQIRNIAESRLSDTLAALFDADSFKAVAVFKGTAVDK